jgi:hypothetical protein
VKTDEKGRGGGAERNGDPSPNGRWGKAIFFCGSCAGDHALDFSKADRERMNELAARNRDGRLSPHEDEELDNYIWVGQILGILQSKARQSLPSGGRPSGSNRNKS